VVTKGKTKAAKKPRYKTKTNTTESRVFSPLSLPQEPPQPQGVPSTTEKRNEVQNTHTHRERRRERERERERRGKKANLLLLGAITESFGALPMRVMLPKVFLETRLIPVNPAADVAGMVFLVAMGFHLRFNQAKRACEENPAGVRVTRVLIGDRALSPGTGLEEVEA